MPRRKAIRRPILRSPIEPGSLVLNWKLVGFLIPLLGIVGTWAISQYQLKEHEKKFDDQEIRIRQLERIAANADAAVLTRIEAQQDDMFKDVERIKAKLGIR